VVTKYIKPCWWLLPAALAWAAVLGSIWLVPWLAYHVPLEPHLPRVSMPPAERDYVSSVGALALIFAFAGGSALIVEVAKFLALREARPPVMIYLGLLLFQFSLILDVFRIHGQDWLMWWLAWIGVRSLADWHPAVEHNATFPSVSLAFLLLVTGQCLWIHFKSERLGS
jgi:hypothetical protein